MNDYFELLIERIVNSLLENEFIENSELDAYRYGIEIVYLKSIHYGSYFIIACLMKKIPEFMVVFSVFYLLRRDTGGFHAKTRLGCYLFSCITVWIFLLCTNLQIAKSLMLAITGLAICLFFILGTVETKNRKLDEEDLCRLHHRLIKSTNILMLLYIVCGILGYWDLMKLYTLGVAMNMFLFLLGKIQSMAQLNGESNKGKEIVG